MRTTAASTAIRRGPDRRWPRDEVLATASAAGFTCGEEKGDDAEAALRCTRGPDRVTVHFKTGRSAKIQRFGPEDKAERDQFYQRIVFRFGLLRTYDDGPEPPEVWRQPGSPARITAWSGAIILTDTEAAR